MEEASTFSLRTEQAASRSQPLNKQTVTTIWYRAEEMLKCQCMTPRCTMPLEMPTFS